MSFTLLVVDDSKSSRKVNTAFVKSVCGDTVDCIEAVSGEEALTVLAARPVALVLLDLTMPGISGYDVLAELRRRHQTVPVIVISADIQLPAKKRVAELGAIGFIEKPITEAALRAILTKLGVVHG